MAPRVLTFKSVRMGRTSLKMRKGTDIMGKMKKAKSPPIIRVTTVRMRLVHRTGALRKFRPQFGHLFNGEVRQIKPLKGFLVLKFAGVRVSSPAAQQRPLVAQGGSSSPRWGHLKRILHLPPRP